MFISAADQFEQDRSFGLIFGDIGDVVEDEEVIAIEFGDCRFEHEVLPRDLQALDEIGGVGEQDTVARFDQCPADGHGEMAFTDAGRSRDILPGITTLKGEFSILFIRDAVNR